MLTPQSTRGSPRDAPYDPRQRPKKSFEVWCASYSAPSVTNSIHDPRVTGRTDAYRKEASVDVADRGIAPRDQERAWKASALPRIAQKELIILINPTSLTTQTISPALTVG